MPKPLALVSGITGTIGSAISARLLDEGYAVIGLSRTPSQDVTAAGARLMRCNVTSLADIWRIGRDVPHCEVFVAAHGHPPITCPTLDVSCEEFEDVWETDVSGTFLLVQAVACGMVQRRRGDIILLSSLHARQTYPARVPYAAAKAAVVGMMRSMALEWGPYGVKVNAVLPWQVAGPRTTALIDGARQRGEDLEEAYLQRCPQRRLVQPQDVAQAVLALIDNPACNGVELVLDGGVSQGMWHQGYKEDRREP